MKILIQKRDIGIVFFMVLGIFFLIYGMWDHYSVRSAMPLEELTSENIQKGKYIKGTVTEYCGVVVEGIGEETFIGQSVNFWGLTGERLFYTVKLEDGHYITLMAKYDETKNALLAYENGIGGNAYIEGVITSPATELNYPWLQTALGQDTREKLEEVMLTDYAIREHDFSKKGIGMVYGFVFIWISVAMIVSDRIEKRLVEKTIIESLKKHNFYKGK